MAATDGPTTWPRLIARLVRREDLTSAETSWAMAEVMGGGAPSVPLAGFLVALRAKGETVAELSGLVEVMLERAVALPLPADLLAASVDLVGTGGDLEGTVNISTMAALVTAAAGTTVVKHGNRASSSLCGSADLLEELGVRLDLPPARVGELAAEVGITFCFANAFHPAMRHAAPTRRELGVPTAFNLLGPLTNPARTPASAIGVADRTSAPLMAGVLAARGSRGLVFRGEDGLDELTTTGPSTVWEVRDGAVTEQRFDPADLGLGPATLDDLRGGGPAVNAGVTRALLEGRRGPVRDAVLLNAAAALVAADPQPARTADGTVRPLAERLAEAHGRAASAVDAGAAADLLQRWVSASAA